MISQPFCFEERHRGQALGQCAVSWPLKEDKSMVTFLNITTPSTWGFAYPKCSYLCGNQQLSPLPLRTRHPGDPLPSLTLLGDSERDQPCSLHKGAMRLKLKFPGHVASVEARVIQGDVEYSDGHILQVFASVPL